MICSASSVLASEGCCAVPATAYAMIAIKTATPEAPQHARSHRRCFGGGGMRRLRDGDDASTSSMPSSEPWTGLYCTIRRLVSTAVGDLW